MNNSNVAKSLVVELAVRIADLEAIGALVAAAHLNAAITILCRDFVVPRDTSRTD